LFEIVQMYSQLMEKKILNFSPKNAYGYHPIGHSYLYVQTVIYLISIGLWLTCAPFKSTQELCLVLPKSAQLRLDFVADICQLLSQALVVLFELFLALCAPDFIPDRRDRLLILLLLAWWGQLFVTGVLIRLEQVLSRWELFEPRWRDQLDGRVLHNLLLAFKMLVDLPSWAFLRIVVVPVNFFDFVDDLIVMIVDVIGDCHVLSRQTQLLTNRWVELLCHSFRWTLGSCGLDCNLGLWHYLLLFLATGSWLDGCNVVATQKVLVCAFFALID